ncbi:uncharacterized protein I206_105404 [Kwoniella pini CBS 10737]|uniref:Uncharacterized protein n=1 Tax=Kwoniella pini CBS 10737 TaxID=1296096 RepID=A0A1B9I4D3_9TREE|nr:uncharacterized protein I206_03690 [Kwoniella pini CBS 10737]OCF50369.1 hypothetical protein I206_03690 [Kwoniella pini CBS 10737]
MPSLADTLDTLSTRTSELAYLSTLNNKPSGPFVQAYLGGSSTSSSSKTSRKKGNVLSLIRDSNESEIRLFKFIGESSIQNGISSGGGGGGGGGGNKKVEKRENNLVTPLKELKKNKNQMNGRDEIEIVLKTALKLVDDYRPMPRARAHIANLLDSHHSSRERLLELERLIEEASKPQSSTSVSSAKPPSPVTVSETSESTPTDQPKLTADEAIKAEEAALRALEASLIPLRKAHQSQEDRQPTGYSPPPPSTKTLLSSPPTNTQTPAKTPGRTFTTTNSMQTPAKQMPHVTNSLVVNGMTPRRVDRFSPLRLLTPKVPIGSSNLGNENPETGGGRRSIFGRPSNVRQSVLNTPASSSTIPKPAAGVFSTPYNNYIAEGNERTPAPLPNVNAQQQAIEEQEEDDQTIRIPSSPPVLAPPIEPVATPAKAEDEVHNVETMNPMPAVTTVSDDGTLNGVDLNAEGVKAGIAKVWNTLGEMMRQGMKDGQEVTQDVESSIKHLIHLSTSDLPAPPSPSSSSATSITTINISKPITSETILFSHLLLSILRSINSKQQSLTNSINGQEVGGVDMNEMKESLTSIAKARNFDGANTVGTKIIYAAVGKRTISIDRKGGSGKIRFAI